ncbi:MAG: 2-polyprenyl-3-methyl-5-hydroxy-6-metoxy-1,4-benzoquinol methylase [Verrucomicrobiales bacterium]|jgi:2-polyprenyl-3-methyl-5-hydroxy-6-metoxy-1,4-benzoquinol methylase
MGDNDTPAKQTPGNWTSVDTDWYDSRWKQMAAQGHNPHGEADFVSRFAPASVLDAGCGTGRLAIELAARGCDVAAVDLDLPMIEAAQQKAPELDIRHGDLAFVDLERAFDVVVMAGNVMIFVAPGTVERVVHNMARHVNVDGRLISGFQLDRGLAAADYSLAVQAAGLVEEERWSTWDGEAASDADAYVVFVHRRGKTSGGERP